MDQLKRDDDAETLDSQRAITTAAPTIVQGTPEWFAERRGRITASRAAACLGLGYDSAREAWRQITGRSPKQQPNEHMRRGLVWEETTRRRYEACMIGMGQLMPWERVEPGGFWVHPQHQWLAASPDGIVGTAGLVELKNPMSLATSCKIYYRIQCIVQMACTGRQWCDFFSWPPCIISHYWERIARPSESALESLISMLGAWHEEFVVGDKEPPDGRSESARARVREVAEQAVKWGCNYD